MAKTNHPLSPREIRYINKRLTDSQSDFYLPINSEVKVRFESLMDFILMNLNKETIKIFKYKINLETAFTILENAEREVGQNPDFVQDTEWRQKQEKRIFSCESYEYPHLGKLKCPPPNGLNANRISAERESLDWWTWQLNEYQKNIYGYTAEITGIIDTGEKKITLEPSYDDNKVAVFDRPTDLTNDGVDFILEIELEDANSSEEINFTVQLAFKD